MEPSSINGILYAVFAMDDVQQLEGTPMTRNQGAQHKDAKLLRDEGTLKRSREKVITHKQDDDSWLESGHTAHTVPDKKKLEKPSKPH